MRIITAKEFESAIGAPPDNDDLDRCNCNKAGQLGHWSCGWCETHNKPRFICGCFQRLEEKLLKDLLGDKTILAGLDAYEEDPENIEDDSDTCGEFLGITRK